VEKKTADVSTQAEEYLETIYRLQSRCGYARTMELARDLGVVPGSITNTVENLEKKGLVIHEPYKGVKLTDNGKRIAINIIRKHRLAERLLTDLLNLDWSVVHDPACKLEHAFSPEIIKSLEKKLGHPKTCPHGNPIPTKCGGILEEESIVLTELEPQSEVVIVKITEERTRTLEKLDAMKLRPGRKIRVENRDCTGSLLIKLGKEKHVIDHDLAAIIFVKKDFGV
jgi:DtxR family Mn-dependent transcriptional regulator